MSTGKVLLAILGGLVAIVVIVVLSMIGVYNGLVNKRAATDATWAQVQNVYQRRYDLVPNLVNTVAGAANFEKSTLTAVTDARASVGRVTTQLPAGAAPTDQKQLDAFAQAQGQLGATLSRLLVVSERYPELRATQSFRDLQAQLEGTENRIAVERGRFNAAVQDYDASIARFPAVVIAGMFNFTAKPYFAAQTGAENAPKVDFSGKF